RARAGHVSPVRGVQRARLERRRHREGIFPVHGGSPDWMGVKWVVHTYLPRARGYTEPIRVLVTTEFVSSPFAGVHRSIIWAATSCPGSSPCAGVHRSGTFSRARLVCVFPVRGVHRAASGRTVLTRRVFPVRGVHRMHRGANFTASGCF